MDVTKHPVITVGGGVGNGLGIARNLGQQGIPVYCVCSNLIEMMRYSKYCQRFFHVLKVESDPAVLRRFLRALAPRLSDRAVLFATSDTAVLTLAQVQKDLPREYVAVVPEYEVAETMVRKALFYKSLQRWNVYHPLTLYSTEHTPAEIERAHTFPVYIRPSESLPFVVAFGLKGFVASNRRELHTYLRLADQHGFEVMVQEIIPGPTRNGYVFKGLFDRRGRLVMGYTQRKIRQPSMFSNSPIHVSIQAPPDSSLARFQHGIIDYLTKIQYTGLFGAEFKLDPRDGQFKLLEVNARTMGDSYIGIEYGMNDVLASYRDALGNDVEPIHSYTPGIWFVAELGYLKMLITRALKRRISRRDLLPYFQHKFWFLFSRHDIKPFLIYLLPYLYWECRQYARARKIGKDAMEVS